MAGIKEEPLRVTRLRNDPAPETDAERTMVSHCSRGWCARTADGETISCRSRNQAFDAALGAVGRHGSRWGVAFEDGCRFSESGCPLLLATAVARRRAQFRLVVVRGDA